MDAQACIACLNFLSGPPLVAAPMDGRRQEGFHAQDLTCRNAPALIVEAPDRVCCADLVEDITLLGLWRHIKYAPFVQRPPQFDVLGVCPYERHSGACGLAAIQ